jgi:hypothetical protein
MRLTRKKIAENRPTCHEYEAEWEIPDKQQSPVRAIKKGYLRGRQWYKSRHLAVINIKVLAGGETVLIDAPGRPL